MDTEKLITELDFKAVRSGGAGGQHVNKVASKAVLTFSVALSQALSDDEKALVKKNLATRLTRENILSVSADEDRSQSRNKEIATRRLIELIQKALIVPKKRKPTKVPRAVVEKRIKAKRSQSELKQSRRRPEA